MAAKRYVATLRKNGRRARFDQSCYPGFAYKKTGKRSCCWVATVDGDDLRAIAARAREDGLALDAVPVEFARSLSYRKEYFSADRGPYRCRYCNRKLDREDLTVDHLVPVAAARKSWNTRWTLLAAGAEGVNDVKNLAPACPRRNGRKGAKGGLWIVRGLLGRYKLYWIVLRAAQAVLVATALVAAWGRFVGSDARGTGGRIAGRRAARLLGRGCVMRAGCGHVAVAAVENTACGASARQAYGIIADQERVKVIGSRPDGEETARKNKEDAGGVFGIVTAKLLLPIMGDRRGCVNPSFSAFSCEPIPVFQSSDHPPDETGRRSVAGKRCDNCKEHYTAGICSSSRRAAKLAPGKTYLPVPAEGSCEYWLEEPVLESRPGPRPSYRAPSSAPDAWDPYLDADTSSARCGALRHGHDPKGGDAAG